MMTIQAEIRNSKTKAKALRRAGLVPGSISEGQSGQSRLIALPASEARRFLRQAGTGAPVELMLEGKPCRAILREKARDSVTQELQHLSFQAVEENTRVASVARIVLINRDKQTASVTQTLFEVPYTARVQDLVQTVCVNVAALSAGSRLTVGELEPLAGNQLELGLAKESLVVKVTDSRRSAGRREA